MPGYGIVLAMSSASSAKKVVIAIERTPNGGE